MRIIQHKSMKNVNKLFFFDYVISCLLVYYFINIAIICYFYVYFSVVEYIILLVQTFHILINKYLVCFFSVQENIVRTKILVCRHVPKKSVVLACLTMSKLKMNQHVPNKNADLLKKINLMGTEQEKLC